MNDANRYKPSHEEWMRWAQVVADRLALCSHIYTQNQSAIIDRQIGNAVTGDLLRRLYRLIDDTETPTDSLAEVAHHDEQAIDGLVVLMQDTLQRLPALSADMQNLLKSHWRENFSNPLAKELFYGFMDAGLDGIGSGHIENGRLPAMLDSLLMREQVTGRRRPRSALVRHNISRPDTETFRRWADINSRFMRRAGQVE